MARPVYADVVFGWIGHAHKEWNSIAWMSLSFLLGVRLPVE